MLQVRVPTPGIVGSFLHMGEITDLGVAPDSVDNQLLASPGICSP